MKISPLKILETQIPASQKSNRVRFSGAESAATIIREKIPLTRIHP
jgi:hypothetical protein